MKISRILAPLALAAVIAACSGGDSAPRWSVNGTLAGAEGENLLLQRFVAGRWVTIDSTRIAADGTFGISRARMDYPDFYRIGFEGGDPLYFPIDSTETVTVTATDSILSHARIGGSRSADYIQAANDLIDSVVAAKGASAALADADLKRRLYDEVILPSQADLAPFYVITRTIDGRLLFDPADKQDFNIIRAVANFFNQHRPNDPRTEELRRLVLPSGTLVAEEIGFPEISLMGLDGADKKLSSLVGHGKPVIVCFSANTLETAPAINQTLAFAWHNNLADIYQISLDPNEVAWREVAANLPWTSVYVTPNAGDRVLRDYNVASIPTLFIIDRKGQLAERVTDISTLESLLKKY